MVREKTIENLKMIEDLDGSLKKDLDDFFRAVLYVTIKFLNNPS